MAVAHLINGDDRLDIAYLDENSEAGKTVLLVHGFASNRQINWVNTGWVKALKDAGYRVVAFDNRGHGESSKFHEISDYPLEKMAGDAIALLDYLGIERADVIGYSMGARIAATLAMHHGERFDKFVLSGNGWGMVEPTGNWDAVRDALLTSSPVLITHPRGKAFRAFAEQTKSDRVALAACVIGARQLFTVEDLQAIKNRVLVAVGTEDDVAGDGGKLAAALPNGEYLPIPGRDHMKAVGDRTHIRGVLDFLAGD